MFLQLIFTFDCRTNLDAKLRKYIIWCFRVTPRCGSRRQSPAPPPGLTCGGQAVTGQCATAMTRREGILKIWSEHDLWWWLCSNFQCSQFFIFRTFVTQLHPALLIWKWLLHLLHMLLLGNSIVKQLGLGLGLGTGIRDWAWRLGLGSTPVQGDDSIISVEVGVMPYNWFAPPPPPPTHQPYYFSELQNQVNKQKLRIKSTKKLDELDTKVKLNLFITLLTLELFFGSRH